METVDKWHRTKLGHLTFGVAELLIAYGFASWAINSGELWQYALGFVFLYGGLRNWFRIFRNNEHKRR